VTSRDEIAASVIAIATRISGLRTPIEEDHYVDRDLAIGGWDCVDLLNQIEDRWDVDLRPWMESIAEYRRGWFRKRLVTRDATIREIVDQVAALRA